MTTTKKIKYYQFIILYITYLLNILYILVIRTFCDWLNYGQKKCFHLLTININILSTIYV